MHSIMTKRAQAHDSSGQRHRRYVSSAFSVLVKLEVVDRLVECQGSHLQPGIGVEIDAAPNRLQKGSADDDCGQGRAGRCGT
jgi:hypothetical protein